jgi:hypothetical protein
VKLLDAFTNEGGRFRNDLGKSIVEKHIEDIEANAKELAKHAGGLKDGIDWLETMRPPSELKDAKFMISHEDKTLLHDGIAASLKNSIVPLQTVAV